MDKTLSIVKPEMESEEYFGNWIDHLHETFFGQIFEQIEEIGDQVRMARAYPQFLPEIRVIWQKRWPLRAVGPNAAFLPLLDVDDYMFFMQNMADLFINLRVNENGNGVFAKFHKYVEHLREINITEFPRIESCVLCGNPDTVVDADIRDLATMLPNLKRLTTGMNISGRYLVDFRQLEQIIFKSTYYPLPLEDRWMQQFCMDMPNLRVLDMTETDDSNVRLYDIDLPNLEVLSINLSTVENIVSQVLQLPKLRKLAISIDASRQFCAHKATIFKQIIVAKSETITRIALDNDLVQLPLRWQQNLVLELPKLRSLVCENWTYEEFFLDRHEIPCHQMEVLSFIGWEKVRDNKLFEMISECPELSHLALNGQHSNPDKLLKLRGIRSMSRSTKPLQVFSETMWTDLPADIYNAWRADKYVHVYRDCTEYDFHEDGFEFDFA